MNPPVLEEVRQYIIPLFTMKADGNGVFVGSRKFLGTAFFVTRQGDAVTAAHVLPPPASLAEELRLVAVVVIDGKEQVCWVNHAAVFQAFDVALLKVNLPRTKYLSISAEPVLAGTDVQVIGIPNHEVVGAGKEMRILKGHVTFAHDRLELSFPIPSGMSGSPVMAGPFVVGYATGKVRSEEIEDQHEEIVKLTDTREQIRITTTSSVIYYGLAFPFSKLATAHDPILENRTLLEFIAERNREP